MLIRHNGGLIPNEIVLKPGMFLKVQYDLCMTEHNLATQGLPLLSRRITLMDESAKRHSLSCGS